MEPKEFGPPKLYLPMTEINVNCEEFGLIMNYSLINLYANIYINIMYNIVPVPRVHNLCAEQRKKKRT